MAYATADEYRARIQSGRTDDAVILEVLNAAQDQIHQRTGRRFDTATATRTVRVINAAAYLPDLVTATDGAMGIVAIRHVCRRGVRAG